MYLKGSYLNMNKQAIHHILRLTTVGLSALLATSCTSTPSNTDPTGDTKSTNLHQKIVQEPIILPRITPNKGEVGIPLTSLELTELFSGACYGGDRPNYQACTWYREDGSWFSKVNNNLKLRGSWWIKDNKKCTLGKDNGPTICKAYVLINDRVYESWAKVNPISFTFGHTKNAWRKIPTRLKEEWNSALELYPNKSSVAVQQKYDAAGIFLPNKKDSLSKKGHSPSKKKDSLPKKKGGGFLAGLNTVLTVANIVAEGVIQGTNQALEQNSAAIGILAAQSQTRSTRSSTNTSPTPTYSSSGNSSSSSSGAKSQTRTSNKIRVPGVNHCISMELFRRGSHAGRILHNSCGFDVAVSWCEKPCKYNRMTSERTVRARQSSEVLETITGDKVPGITYGSCPDKPKHGRHNEAGSFYCWMLK